MTYHGKVRNGVVVIRGKRKPAEGTEVSVRAVRNSPAKIKTKTPRRAQKGSKNQTLGQWLLRFAGVAKGLPSDLALNHDHYLYGVPKK